MLCPQITDSEFAALLHAVEQALARPYVFLPWEEKHRNSLKSLHKYLLTFTKSYLQADYGEPLDDVIRSAVQEATEQFTAGAGGVSVEDIHTDPQLGDDWTGEVLSQLRDFPALPVMLVPPARLEKGYAIVYLLGRFYGPECSDGVEAVENLPRWSPGPEEE